MKKLSVVLALAMIAALVACSTSAPAATTAPQAPAATAPAANVTATEKKSLYVFDPNRQMVEDTDIYPDAVLYSDILKKFGPIPYPPSGVKIGFVAKAYENEFWRAVKEGVEDQIKALNSAGVNVEGDVRAAQSESDEQGQAAIMNDMINKGYAAIIASPISDGNLVPSTEKAHAAGIPVINAIGGFAKEMDVFVGPRHYQSGELAAEWIAKALGNEGEVAVIMGLPKESAARGRTQGFGDWLEKNAPNMKLVATQNADWDRTKAKEVMDTLIKAHPNLKAVYCNNDTMAMGALEAVKNAKLLGKLLVVGNDGTSEALQSIKDGELSATVNIYPYFGGKISVDIALRVLAGQKMPLVIYTTQALIDPSNVGKTAEEVTGWQELQFQK